MSYLRDITLVENDNYEVKNEDGIISPVIYIEAERRKNTKILYKIKDDSREKFIARRIPYFSYCNRGVTDRLIWKMIK